jgi:hypothetical protein
MKHFATPAILLFSFTLVFSLIVTPQALYG